MSRFIIPLYDVEVGGPPQAFRCSECPAVCRTQVGLLIHLRRVHELKAQATMFPEACATKEDLCS